MRLFIFLLSLLFSFHVFANPVFTIKSPAFENNKKIPELYTCDGKDISPQLAWNDAPANTETFALIVHDPDAPKGTVYHWVLFNIPKDTNLIAENSSPPESSITGKNTAGNHSYKGPCPPKGEHRYFFTLYALDTKLSLKDSANASEVLAEITKHTLAKTEIIGRYSRKSKNVVI